MRSLSWWGSYEGGAEDGRGRSRRGNAVGKLPLGVDTLALRLAAGGGTIDDLGAPALVAAGFTLLQRSPALRRALGRGPSAILLPPSPQFVVALAASEGREAILIDPNLGLEAIASAVRGEGAGAVLTFAALGPRLPGNVTRVFLDEAPRLARVVAPDGAATTVDLGSHFGLTIEGATDVPGRDEPCLVTDLERAGAPPLRHSHRALLEAAAFLGKERGITGASVVRASWDWTRAAPLVATLVAPLLAGAAVQTPGAAR
jgi:hypothetical protein